MNIRDLYDYLPVGICIIRHDRKSMDIMYVNETMLEMLGVDSTDTILGHKFDEVWPHPDGKKLVESIKLPSPPDSFMLPTHADEDKKRWIKFGITQDIWEDESCHTLWATDISSNKEVEEKLKSEVKRADALADMKSNFLATMSHEIRTPMQTIYGLLELIADEKPEEKIQDMVDIAKTSASGLLEILDDILDLAKMDANKMELDVFEVPVRMLVRGTLEALSVKVHGVNVQLVDDIDQDVPFVVIGDPKRLRQIIMNLTGNALKFTEEGTVTVRVNANTKHIKVPENRVGLRFEIVDTGIGMSEEVCEKLFGSFTQADSSTSRKYGGTGLGLSISKKLVELMGGQIGVFSEVGKGSTFWFEIPTEEVGTETTTIDLPNLDGISVIAVEDHPQGGKEIVNSLRSMGATVELCPTYAEGLALTKRRPFDVGIIDQGLPDGLGLDLIKEIMQIRPYMGLIMYTVRDDVGMQHSLQALGVKYLTKPASRAGLGEAVEGAASRVKKMTIEGPTRLLIAEDTDSVRYVLGKQLDKLGIEADFVENGKLALEAVKTGKYGLLITDLHMPELDGYGVVDAIREEEKDDESKHFPVIVLTADVQMAQRDTYLSHGFDECLLKPVSMGQFKGLLIRWGLLSEAASSETTTKETSADAPLAQNINAPAIDTEAMKAQMGAFDESTIEMLGMFYEMTAPLIENIKTAQDEGDLHNLAEHAHSLKGGARSACCNVLGDLASDLQDSAEKGENAPELVEKIIAEFARVGTELKSLKAA
ncbi:MAG: response regulator [Alphaproteobacteria bacterium]|nr:response regulator [Alphaproteobacteria bacterium]